MTTHADLSDLKDKDFRDAYVDEHVRATLAYQLRSIRRKRGWSQKRLAAELCKPPSVISRLENVTYGKLNVQTLIDIAQKLDIALIVKFADYKEFLAAYADVSDPALAVDDYNCTVFQNNMSRAETSTAQTPTFYIQGESAYTCSNIVNMPDGLTMEGMVSTPLIIGHTPAKPQQIISTLQVAVGLV